MGRVEFERFVSKNVVSMKSYNQECMKYIQRGERSGDEVLLNTPYYFFFL